MAFTPLFALGTLVFTFVNFLKYARNKDINGVVTQGVAWVAGIAGVAIAAHTQFAGSINFGSLPLNKMNFVTQIFIGLIATSILSTVNEVKKAVDNTDSAAQPPLVGPPTIRPGTQPRR